MISFDNGTGLELQYCYVKLSAILEENSNEDIASDDDDDYLEQEDQINLLRLLEKYPTITQTAYQILELSIISTYLFNITE
jgi:arginyl-tRNA synthetase